MGLTVVVKAVKMNVVGGVVKVEEGLAVRPAFHHDAACLRVERKQRTVEMTGRLHHSAEPPAHLSGVVHVHSIYFVVAVRVETASAAGKSETLTSLE